MAKDQASHLSLRRRCYLLLLLSFFSSFLFVCWSYFSNGCHTDVQIVVEADKRESNLLAFQAAWNSLQFPSGAPSRLLKLAVFVKKWPDKHHAGGLERHAMTLHRDLARRGHELHVFTSASTNVTSMKNLHFHLSKPTAAGYLDQATIWKQFQVENSTGRPFDVVHTESVGLMHFRARNLNNIAVSWHGIAYESIHSDIIQELLRAPQDKQSSILAERVTKVIEEIRFFPRYAHHVATSDHVGDVLVRSHACWETIDGHETCQHHRFCGRQPRNRIHVFTNSRRAEESSVRCVEGWKSYSPEERSVCQGKGLEIVYCHQNDCSLREIILVHCLLWRYTEDPLMSPGEVRETSDGVYSI